jgi:hypothetical protein
MDHLDIFRAGISNGTMTQKVWDNLHPSVRQQVRDLSDLTPGLQGLEGWRVEVVDLDHGPSRRFIVGRSTGWRPCHLEISRISAHGGGSARKGYATIRKIEKVR